MSKTGGGGFWASLFGRKKDHTPPPNESKVAISTPPATPPKGADEPLYDNIDILEKSALNAPPPPASPPAGKEIKKDVAVSSIDTKKDKEHGPAKKPDPPKPSKADPSKLTPATLPAPSANPKSKELVNQQTVQISLQQDNPMSAAPQSVGQEIPSKDPNIVTNYKSAPIVSAMSVPPKPIRQSLPESSGGTTSTCKTSS